MAVDKKKAQQLMDDLQSALKAVADKHGLTLTKNHITYGDMIKVALNFEVKGGLSKDEITYTKWRYKLGLPPIGHHFTYKGQTAVAVGLRVGGPYKSLIFTMGGKTYRNQVKYMLEVINGKI